MAVGEIFVSAILKELLSKLASGKLQSFAKEVGVGPKLKKWENMLKMIQAVIEDAEAEQVRRRAVKVWLAELQDLAHEMEDILDEFATKALGRKLKAEKPGSSAGKVLNKIPDVKSNFRMWSKMKSITTQLKELSYRVTALGLRATSGERSAAAYTRPTSISLAPPKKAVYGRDEDKAKILKMMGDAAGETSFSVISVIGMGGIGKTTLAREVFHDKSVEKHKKVWVSVPQDFDVLKISKEILRPLLSPPFAISEWGLNQVLVELKKQLAGKLFLLVLDDVWSRRDDLVLDDVSSETDDLSALWESLTSSFTDVARGSGIIVTTRHKQVASVMGSHQHILELKLLSNDDCLSVFMTHAPDNIRAHQNLKEIQEKVVERCKGLPLAARALGKLLGSRQREWENILNSKLWDTFAKESSVLPVLRLSYYHLPSHLQRCFAYCAIFPKGFEFEEDELVLLWMAEGLLQPEENTQLEELGHDYFHDLLSMSLFQRSSTNGSKFIMHDLISDLTQWISGETTFTLKNEITIYRQSRSFDRALHISYSPNYCDGKKQFEKYHEAKRLRTLLAIVSDDSSRYLSDQVLPSLLPKLKKLRVLSLQTYQISQLPNSIASLRHIRYLNFSRTAIRNLPDSINTLYNLQILTLKGCWCLKMLPSKVGNLVNLRHLNIEGAYLIREMPLGMNKLERLQTLSNFVVGKSTGSSLIDLKALKLIGGELHISGLENIYNSNKENDYNADQDITEAILVDKQYLEVLILEWASQFDESRDEVAEKNVLDVLKPHGNLKELTIKCYAGRNFPSWVGDPSLSKLTVLRLESCVKCESLPPLGLLDSLKDLTIKDLRGLKHIGSEIYGKKCSIPFKSLKSLYFEDLQQLELWDTVNENQHIQIFSCLCVLSIVNCPKLLAIPSDHLPSLENLVIHQCAQLTLSVYNAFPILRSLEIRECLALMISVGSLPMLTELEISGCTVIASTSLIDFMSLKSVILSDISMSVNWFMHGFATVKSLKIDSCEELMNLWQDEYETIHFEKIGQPLSSLTFLRELCISNCSSLVSFPKDHFFSFLNKLDVRCCSALTSLPEGIKHGNARLECLEIFGCDSLTFIFSNHLPSSLKILSVSECKELQCLFNDKENIGASVHEENISDTSHLEKLIVVQCDSLTCLSSGGQLPVALKHLSVVECSALTTLSSGPLPSTLKHLSVKYCNELTSLSIQNCQLPQTLEYLDIDRCSKLVSIAHEFHSDSSLENIQISDCEKLESLPDGLDNSGRLQSVTIWRCSNLVSFPEGGLPATKLSYFWIFGCQKLEALPNHMYGLNSLQDLTIYQCPSISFPKEEGFPTQIKKLRIKDFPIYQQLIQWGLHKLTSLRELEISECSDAESFPQEEKKMKLPTSLTHLTIADFLNLKELFSKGFRNLSSLEYLSIVNCPNLKSFPEVSLPSSLLELYIGDCPLLTQRSKKSYRKSQPKMWPKIAHIPLVMIDSRFIKDLEEE